MAPEKLLPTIFGLAVTGVAGMLLAPVMLPALARVARPVAKGVLKSGLIMASRGRETVAELGEVAEDLLAEVRAELATEAAARSAPAATATGSAATESGAPPE